jgi:hypothetical protein
MMKMTLAAATATAMIAVAPWFAGSVPGKAEGLQLAQGIDLQIGRDRDEKAKVGRDRDEKVQVGRDRDEKARRDRRDEGADVTVGVGPKGLVVGPQEKCKTVTTTVERDGRKETSRERRCD